MLVMDPGGLVVCTETAGRWDRSRPTLSRSSRRSFVRCKDPSALCRRPARPARATSLVNQKRFANHSKRTQKHRTIRVRSSRPRTSSHRHRLNLNHHPRIRGAGLRRPPFTTTSSGYPLRPQSMVTARGRRHRHHLKAIYTTTEALESDRTRRRRQHRHLIAMLAEGVPSLITANPHPRLFGHTLPMRRLDAAVFRTRRGKPHTRCMMMYHINVN